MKTKRMKRKAVSYISFIYVFIEGDKDQANKNLGFGSKIRMTIGQNANLVTVDHLFDPDY